MRRDVSEVDGAPVDLAAAQGKTGGVESADAAGIAHHNGWI